MHKSVGAIIRNEKGEILMIDRAIKPYGWACPAGHIDENENSEQAAVREVKEEVGLDVEELKLLFHEFIDWSECSKGALGHDWYLYEILDWHGEMKISEREVKDAAWLSQKEIGKIDLEKVWRHWFEKLGII